MSGPCPTVVIAGTGSGVGKTSLSLGLVAALTRRGLRVQTFKVGPDFLDPSYLTLASGRPCYNLDGWMCGREYVCQLFARATAQADVAVVEGVMGLFDGASSVSLEGSTAEIAAWLEATVLLVVNAHGAARSLAATVKGFVDFEPTVRIGGVIANQSGSARHRAGLIESLQVAKLPPLVGAVPRNSLPPLQSRHLGLVTADHQRLSPRTLDQLADACEQHLDIASVLALPRAAATAPSAPTPAVLPRYKIRLGVARDEAFHFYYADNLEMLQAKGADLVWFSPLRDTALPSDLDGLYVGGGYPELHASELAANHSMLAAIRRFAESGRTVYAECGGLMYLGRSVQTLDGRRHALAGVLPVDTAMLKSLHSLGYIEATLAADSPWGGAGQVLRGHEFHYSRIIADDALAQGWQKAYGIRRRREGDALEGFQKGRILASYVHLHFSSRPQAVDHFLHQCEAQA